jgi:hypothetical protein
LTEGEGRWGLEKSFGWVRSFGSGGRQAGLGKRFRVVEEKNWFRVKMGWAWEGVLGG